MSLGSKRSSNSKKSLVSEKKNSPSTSKESANPGSNASLNVSQSSLPDDGKPAGMALSLWALNECVGQGTGPHRLPIGTILVVAVCIIIHLPMVDVPMLQVNNACLGLYQVFYLQVRASSVPSQPTI